MSDTLMPRYAAPDAEPQAVALDAGVQGATEALLALQRDDGHWCFELEADATIPAEYILLQHFLDEIDADVEAGLVAFGVRLLELALQPDALAFLRLFIAQAPRFPDLAKLFVERNRQRNLGEIARVLAAYLDRGAIGGDLEMRAEQFFILVVGIPQRLAMLVGREPRQQEERRLRAAVRLFLDGCRSR